MKRFLLFAGFVLFAAAAAAAPGAPSGPSAPALPPGTYSDTVAGFHLVPPDGWTAIDPSEFTVPGTLRAGWGRVDHSSILVFTVHLDVPVNSSFLITQQKAAAGKLKAKVSEAQQRVVSGMQAMSVVLTAAGTGGAIDPTGDEPTTQHWVAIPHQNDVLFVLLTAREEVFGDLDPVFQKLLASLVVNGIQTTDQATPR
jgi:hypothetical protein